MTRAMRFIFWVNSTTASNYITFYWDALNISVICARALVKTMHMPSLVDKKLLKYNKLSEGLPHHILRATATAAKKLQNLHNPHQTQECP